MCKGKKKRKDVYDEKTQVLRSSVYWPALVEAKKNLKKQIRLNINKAEKQAVPTTALARNTKKTIKQKVNYNRNRKLLLVASDR